MKLDKYYKILKFKKIANLVIALTSIASILIILFTIYGKQVGNFVIAVQEQNRYTLSLSEHYSFDKSFSRLTAEGLKRMRETTFGDIPDDLNLTDGSNNDPENREYLAYTFYLKNTSDVPLSYNSKISIIKVSKNVDSAIRVMVIRNDEEPVIYAKWREAPEPEEVIGTPELHLDDYDYFGRRVLENYSTTPFKSEVTVCDNKVIDFAKDGIDKYTVVMWIEGMDAQCTNDEVTDIMNGTLKMDMTFSVIN